MWALNLHERPKLTQDTVSNSPALSVAIEGRPTPTPSPKEFCLLLQVIAVLPLAAVHTLGNLLTNVSLGKVAVSFTHTIKVGSAPLESSRSWKIIKTLLQYVYSVRRAQEQFTSRS